MYYSDIGPHVRGQGGKIIMYEERFIFFYQINLRHLSLELLEWLFILFQMVLLKINLFPQNSHLTIYGYIEV